VTVEKTEQNQDILWISRDIAMVSCQSIVKKLIDLIGIIESATLNELSISLQYKNISRIVASNLLKVDFRIE